MTGVIGALGAVGRRDGHRRVDRGHAAPSRPSARSRQTPPGAGALESRIWKLSAVTYRPGPLALLRHARVREPGSAENASGGPEPVAIFATSYFVASSTVTLVVSGFRGIYRPAFAHVMAGGERAQLQRAFDLINKVQVLAVVPGRCGAGGHGGRLPAAALRRSRSRPPCRLRACSSSCCSPRRQLAVGLLVLWVDERYRAVLTAQAVMIAGAPLFIWTAAEFGLLPSAIVLGGSRLAASLLGYTEARRLYDVRYPWRFAAKVTLVSLVMVACLCGRARDLADVGHPGRRPALSSALSIVALGLRLFRVLGPGELELLERASIPGKHLLVRWLGARSSRVTIRSAI